MSTTFTATLSLGLALLLAPSCSHESSRQDAGDPAAGPASEATLQVSVEGLTVEAACGQCQFDLPGEGCALAVRLPVGTSFFVDGTAIDEHGDAHADDGFCNAVRQAVITGETRDGRLLVSSFELLPATESPVEPQDG